MPSESKPTATVLAEMKELFGPPPVLSSEDPKAYDKILSRLIESYSHRDIMEMMLIRELADCCWEIIRYQRHKALGIERKFRQRLEFQAKRIEAAKIAKAARAREAKEAGGTPATRIGRMHALEGAVESVSEDVDAILERIPKELDHAHALEAGIDYHLQLDKLLVTAITRREHLVDLYEQYGDDSSKRQARASQKAVEDLIEELQFETPLVPSAEQGR